MAPRHVLSLPDQIALCVGFFTRIRVNLPADLPDDAIARAVWAFPVAGAAIGALATLVMVVSLKLGLAAASAALVTLAATMLLTGALHEDGLADTADGFGGGRDGAAKLAIMRDSRIGSYGVLALIVSVGLKATCLAQIAGHGQGSVAAALIAAHAGARGALPALMSGLPLARPSGAAAAAGRPASEDAWKAAAIGVLIVLLFLGLTHGLVCVLLGGAAVAGLGRLASQQIGGYTGDVLGAGEQLVEAIVLAVAAST